MKCPQCKKQVDEGAKFCSACGAQVVENAIDAGWVAGIQEEIKECRGSKNAFLWLMAGGMLFAVSPLLIELFVLILAVLAGLPISRISASEYFIWSIPIGVAVAIGGIVGSTYYENKRKKLIRQLTERKQAK